MNFQNGLESFRLWLQSLVSVVLFSTVLAGIIPSFAIAQTRTPAGDPIRQTETTEHQFRVGLALIQSGRPREAAAVFTEILSRHPRLVRVRLELARAYFLSRQWGRARSEFLSVLSGDIPESVRINVLGFLRAIDARRGFDWDANFAFVTLGDTRDYDSDTILVNIGGATLPFTLDGRDGETARGLNYALGATLNRGIPGLSGRDIRTVGFGRIGVTGDEGPGSRFDDLTLTGEFGARLIYVQSSLTLAPFISRRFLAGSVFEDRLGARTVFQHRRRTGTALALSTAWHKIDRRASETRDGHTLIANLSASHPMTPRASVGAQLTVEDRDAQSAIDDFRRTRLTAFGAFDVGRGVTLRPSIYIERKKTERPSSTVAHETGLAAALTVESSRIILSNGFTPYARLAFTRVKSDIKAFSYSESAASIGFERRF